MDSNPVELVITEKEEAPPPPDPTGGPCPPAPELDARLRVLTAGEGSCDMPGPFSLIPKGVPAAEGRAPGAEGHPRGRGGGAAVTCVSRWVWKPSFLVCEAGRLRLTWTRVRCADRGLPCGRRLAAWTRVCCVDTGRGSACGGRSDV